ncbi:hypothetical protein IQ270_05510 [Microcoleus sp. LEGE 07076]|nr:hypothetical protein [Microcoleus sp. LEGE 07076]MBE9184192.1 hypothetical protein [Microcoleus sp. LEGE 07076]
MKVSAECDLREPTFPKKRKVLQFCEWPDRLAIAIGTSTEYLGIFAARI